MNFKCIKMAVELMKNCVCCRRVMDVNNENKTRGAGAIGRGISRVMG